MINEVIICIEDVNVLITMILFYEVFFFVVVIRKQLLYIWNKVSMFVGLHVKLKGYVCASLNETEFSK